MSQNIKPGLGELLRHLSELVDKGSQTAYRDSNLDYRPRYTPVMRALAAGAGNVRQITETMHVSQGAVSQTLKLMSDDGLVIRERGTDGRETRISLSEKGCTLQKALSPRWQDLFAAVSLLEQEIDAPLRQSLTDAIRALNTLSFDKRLAEAKRLRETS